MKSSNLSFNKSTENHTELNYNSNTEDASDDDYEGEAVDMDEFVESGLLEDDSVILCQSSFYLLLFHVSLLSKCFIVYKTYVLLAEWISTYYIHKVYFT